MEYWTNTYFIGGLPYSERSCTCENDAIEDLDDMLESLEPSDDYMHTDYHKDGVTKVISLEEKAQSYAAKKAKNDRYDADHDQAIIYIHRAAS